VILLLTVLKSLRILIRYCILAVHDGNTDTSNVHIIGVSGGGCLALLTYMKPDYPVKSFNAWVPISNLSDWYWESNAWAERHKGTEYPDNWRFRCCS
jgi:alpha-beta hydrolase superfamily lysophospholipase